jgi:hypothetical protein
MSSNPCTSFAHSCTHLPCSRTHPMGGGARMSLVDAPMRQRGARISIARARASETRARMSVMDAPNPWDGCTNEPRRCTDEAERCTHIACSCSSERDSRGYERGWMRPYHGMGARMSLVDAPMKAERCTHIDCSCTIHGEMRWEGESLVHGNVSRVPEPLVTTGLLAATQKSTALFPKNGPLGPIPL